MVGQPWMHRCQAVSTNGSSANSHRAIAIIMLPVVRWHRAQPEILPRAEGIRRLVDIALSGEGPGGGSRKAKV
jgi:hypothetical protein